MGLEHKKFGGMLADMLKEQTSRDVIKTIVELTGYNDSPFFGAVKKKVRLVGELSMLNSALLIYAANQIAGREDAKKIVDSFLAEATPDVFRVLEARDANFKDRYRQRMETYLQLLSEDRPTAGTTAATIMEQMTDVEGNAIGIERLAVQFMRNLDLKPDKVPNKVAETSRYLGSFLGTMVFSLKRLVEFTDRERSREKLKASMEEPAEPNAHISRSTGGFVGMVDVDNFDAINKRLGRKAGDRVMLAFRKLAVATFKTEVALSENGFRAFHADARKRGRSEYPGFVVCFPYDSGDEVVVHHWDESILRRGLEAFQHSVESLVVPTSNGDANGTAIVRGLPVSTGVGTSWKEAWSALLVGRRSRPPSSMSACIEAVVEERAPEPGSAAIKAEIDQAADRLFSSVPPAGPLGGLPMTIDIVSEASPTGRIPVLMWGPVETRRPGWSEERQQKMYGDILAHLRSLGISDIDQFKATAQEVSEASEKIWQAALKASKSTK